MHRCCARAGIGWIGVWRDKAAEVGVAETARQLRAAGVRASSLCRGGFFPAPSAAERRARIDDNRRAADEAAELGSDVLILVCGPAPDRDLDAARGMVEDGIAALLPYAAERRVRLAIEPLHPMFAGDRSVVVTLAQANGLVERLAAPNLGVAVDVYHVWWDPAVYQQIARASGHILGFHVSDWLVPPPHHLLGRGLPGDGVIELQRLRHAVDQAGYTGPIEVEIFNQAVWDTPGDQVLATIQDASSASANRARRGSTEIQPGLKLKLRAGRSCSAYERQGRPVTHLNGSLDGIGLQRLLSFLEELRATGQLSLQEGLWTGVVSLAEGQVVAASFGEEEGLAALDAIFLALPRSRFAIAETHEASEVKLVAQPGEVHERLRQLALEAERLWAAVPSLAHVPWVREISADRSRGGDEVIGLSRSALGLLVAINGSSSVAELARQRGLLSTLRGLAELVQAGLVELAAPPAEVPIPSADGEAADAASQAESNWASAHRRHTTAQPLNTPEPAPPSNGALGGGHRRRPW